MKIVAVLLLLLLAGCADNETQSDPEEDSEPNVPATEAPMGSEMNQPPAPEKPDDTDIHEVYPAGLWPDATISFEVENGYQTARFHIYTASAGGQGGDVGSVGYTQEGTCQSRGVQSNNGVSLSVGPDSALIDESYEDGDCGALGSWNVEVNTGPSTRDLHIIATVTY